MNTALQRKYVAVRKLMAKASGDEIRTRYEIARLILTIQAAPDRYGARGVDKLALALGCDRATLYRYGQVARAFDDKSMRRALAEQKRQRSSLTWSHLVVLSSVSDRAQRMRLLEDAIAGVSVRELERRTRPEAAPPFLDGPSLAIRQYLSMTETFKSRAMLDVDLATMSTSDLDRLLKSQEELREICDRNLRSLREARAESKRSDIPPSRTTVRPRLLAG